VRRFLQNNTARKVKPLWIVNALAAEIPAGLIETLSLYPQIERIEFDSLVTSAINPPAIDAETGWNISAIGADTLWDIGYSGQGVVVASMDTGVDGTHPDLISAWRGGSNSWFDPHNQYSFPTDTDGHGTQTMGVILAPQAIGVAPSANWIAVKIFDDTGSSSLSDIHAGFQWLMDPDNDPNTDDAPDIVNNSWGLGGTTGSCEDEFRFDIQMLKAAGIAVVFSGGNEGPWESSDRSPANYLETFASGAVNRNYIAPLFSSNGPGSCTGEIFPDVVAPGVGIRTTDLSIAGSPAYVTVSGTSFSAAHISGAMAILLSAFSDVSISEIENALKDTALDLGDPSPDNTYGYGMIDLVKAYETMAVSRGYTAVCVEDDDPLDTDFDGITDNDNVCISMASAQKYITTPDGEEMYMRGLVRISGLVPPCQSLKELTIPGPHIVLRQGQKLYLIVTNCETDSIAAFKWFGFANSVPIFAGFQDTSFGLNENVSMTYFFNVTNPGTYLWYGGGIETAGFGQIHVEPAQNQILIDGQILDTHTHRTGDKYAYNDNDGSTHYDVESTVIIGGIREEYESDIDLQTGQKLLLRVSNVSLNNYYTLRTLGLEMRVVATGANLLKGPTGKSLYYKTSSITIDSRETSDVIIETDNAIAGTYFLYTTNFAQHDNSQMPIRINIF
jgi:hypothetical protein